MKLVSPFPWLALTSIVFLLPVNGQMNVPCTTSMLSTFTPCLNFVANSSANGTSPTDDCCTAIRSLASGGRDCLCLIVTGRVPFQIPINRTLAISLPRACNLPGVPLQCNATTAPVPAPGPISPGPIIPPESSASPNPQVPDLTPIVPDAESPTATTGIRPVLTPSSAVRSNSFTHFLLLGFAFVIFKFNYVNSNRIWIFILC